MWQRETTNRRDRSYSVWHRKLGQGCTIPCQDIDYVEYDHGVPVAILELTTSRLAEIQKTVVKNLLKGTDIPAYEVRHNIPLTFFHVIQFVGGDYEGELYWRDYVRFLYSLRGKKAPESAFVKPEVLGPLGHIRPWLSELTEGEKEELVKELTGGDF